MGNIVENMGDNIIPEIVKDNLTDINVRYINYDDVIKNGIITCNKNVSNDLVSIFRELLNSNFPIKQIKPITEFNNDDITSVIANNTSCFNYRMVIGSKKLSDHSTGNAIDINPMENPWLHDSIRHIKGLKFDYDEKVKGTVTPEIANIFKKHGWLWGGDWKNPDYQHFYKPDEELKEKIINSFKNNE